MTEQEMQFLGMCSIEAAKAGHPWPPYAAAEAAEESWNHGHPSELATEAHNLFGTKQHVHAVYGTFRLPTREFINSEWIVVAADFVNYPSIAACFFDRKQTLERLANVYPHYAAALDAKDGRTFVNEVSKTWSTDFDRAKNVLAIFDEWQAALPPLAIAQADGDSSDSNNSPAAGSGQQEASL